MTLESVMERLDPFEHLDRALRAADGLARAWDIARLCQCEDPRLIRRVLALSGSGGPGERRVAAIVLGATAHEVLADERESALRAALATESEDEVVATIVEALGHRGAWAMLTTITRMGDHPASVVREAVVRALEAYRRHFASAEAVLLSMAADEDFDVRNAATFALGQQLSDAHLIAVVLRERLDDDEPLIRAEAVRGLAWVGDRKAVAPALMLVEDGQSAELESALHLLVQATEDPRLIQRLSGDEADPPGAASGGARS